MKHLVRNGSCLLMLSAIGCQFAHAQTGDPGQAPGGTPQSAATRLQAGKVDKRRIATNIDSVGN